MKGNAILLIIFGILIVIILATASLLFLAGREYTKANAQIGENTLIKVEKGQNNKTVAEMLSQQKLIDNKKLYEYGAKIFGKKITPGFYEVPARASMADIINLIDSGKIKLIKVTIPEGWRVEQIATKIAEQNIVDYQSLLSASSKYEGRLFPDTYLMNPRMTAEEVVKMMNDDFVHRTENVTLSEQDLIIASIVEREAANDTDRALIAGIYKNRLQIGMKLQSDPTVEYGRDSNNLVKLSTDEQKEYVFWKSAKTSEFTSVISDYNTYRVKGLPKGPICNPGIASIEATLAPTSSQYYFFLYGTDGKIHPAINQAEHEANIAKYM